MTGAVVHGVVRLTIFMMVVLFLSKVGRETGVPMLIQMVISVCVGVAFGAWAVRPIIKQMVVRSR